MKQPAVHIMASKRNGAIYTGVTSNLAQRAYDHFHEDMPSAIMREKQIKSGSRRAKTALIESINPIWRDLYEGLL